jgi:hypothetical protein
MKPANPLKNINIMLYSFLLLLIMQGCAIDTPYRVNVQVAYDAESKNPLIEFLIEPQSKVADNFNYHLRKTANYAKLPYKRTFITAFNNNPAPAPSTRVLVILDSKTINEEGMTAIINFVASGGTLVLLQASQDARSGYLSGVMQNAPYTINDKASGMVFKNNFIPLMEGKSYANNNVNYGLMAENYAPAVEILATAINDPDYPAIIKNKIGNGNVITFNNTMSPDKQDRGIFFAAILSGLEQVPYPIANVSAVFLDDFPSPMYRIAKEPIKSEFNVTADHFYTNIWWPDMLALAKRHGLKYTAMTCFDYRNRIAPPFTTTEWDDLTGTYDGKRQVSSDWLMHQVVKSGHELAFHGFNHVSLKEDQWDNPDFMEISIMAANKKWITSNYGRLPVSYVPPSNDIDSTGIASVFEGMPSLKYVCSVYLGNFEDGGDREYDNEPYENRLFDFPRITSGYDIPQQAAFDQQSLYLYTGIWSHFVHPDDVYQIKDASNEVSKGAYGYRNISNLGWQKSKNGSDGMLPRFERYIKKIKQTYPLTRFLTVEEAAFETQRWRRRNYEHKVNGNSYTVELVEGRQKQKEAFWFTYVKQSKSSQIENYLKAAKYIFTKTSFLEGYLYNIKTIDGSITLPDNLGEKDKISLTPQKLNAILDTYRAFAKNERSFNNLDEKIAWLATNGNSNGAIGLLKQKIKNGAYNSTDWKLLNTYLGWTSRSSEIWLFMEENLKLENRDSIISLSRFLVENSDYPDLETRQTWMERQLLLYPKDEKLIQEYAFYFETAVKQELTAAALLNLLKKEKKAIRKTQYAELILNDAPLTLLEYLDTTVACSESYLDSLSDQIAWAFADVGNYEQAINWARCKATIDQSVINQWHFFEGNLQYIKEHDYPMYIEYLLEYDRPTVIAELMEKLPCSGLDQELYDDISYAFADQGLFRKALQWSGCVPDFPIMDQIQWYYELKEYAKMESLFTDYTSSHTDNYKLNVFMTNVYMAMGQIKKSWILASGLPQNEETETLRRQLNKDVLYTDYDTLKELLMNYAALFYPETENQIRNKLIYDEGDNLELKTSLTADKFKPNTLGSVLVYGRRDKNANKHHFGLSRYEAYKLQIDSVLADNTYHSLYGVQYEFKRKIRPEMFNFTGGVRIELDQNEQVFYHINAKIAKGKDSLFSALQVSHRPAVTGPAYSLNIYNTNLSVYEEYIFNKTYTGVALLESNYYSDSAWDGTVSLNLSSNFRTGPMSRFFGFVETAGMLGTKENKDSYPYWTLKERLYGGIGIGYEYKNPNNKMVIRIEPSGFLDTFSNSFQRYRGNITLPFLKYMLFISEAEFYSIKNFYSNSINAGIKYYFAQSFNKL